MSLLLVFVSVLESSVGVAYNNMAEGSSDPPEALKPAAVPLCRAATAFVLLFGFVRAVLELPGAGQRQPRHR